MAGNDISIDFTVEELAVLAELLGAPTLPRLGAEPLAHHSTEVQTALLEAGRRSLVARRVLTVGDDGDVLADAVRSLLEVTSQPALLGRAEHEVEGRVETIFYSSVPDVSVEDLELEGSIHRLTPFATEELLTRMLDRCSLTQRPAPDSSPFTTTLGGLRLCGERVLAGDVDGARQALGGNGSSAFVDALLTRVSSSRVTVLYRPSETVIEGGELTWIDGGGSGLWLTPTPDLDADEDELEEALDLEVEIEPTTADAIASELFSYLPGTG
jgi:hypothetical protein